jgi:hypothetical protein
MMITPRKAYSSAAGASHAVKDPRRRGRLPGPDGTFSGARRLRRQGRGTFAGDADAQRQGTFATRQTSRHDVSLVPMHASLIT